MDSLASDFLASLSSDIFKVILTNSYGRIQQQELFGSDCRCAFYIFKFGLLDPEDFHSYPKERVYGELTKIMETYIDTKKEFEAMTKIVEENGTLNKDSVSFKLFNFIFDGELEALLYGAGNGVLNPIKCSDIEPAFFDALQNVIDERFSDLCIKMIRYPFKDVRIQEMVFEATKKSLNKDEKKDGLSEEKKRRVLIDATLRQIKLNKFVTS